MEKIKKFIRSRNSWNSCSFLKDNITASLQNRGFLNLPIKLLDVITWSKNHSSWLAAEWSPSCCLCKQKSCGHRGRTSARRAALKKRKRSAKHQDPKRPKPQRPVVRTQAWPQSRRYRRQRNLVVPPVVQPPISSTKYKCPDFFVKFDSPGKLQKHLNIRWKNVDFEVVSLYVVYKVYYSEHNT